MGWKKPITMDQASIAADVLRVVRESRTRAGIPIEDIRERRGGRLEVVRDAVDYLLSSKQAFAGPNGVLPRNTATAKRWAAVLKSAAAPAAPASPAELEDVGVSLAAVFLDQLEDELVRVGGDVDAAIEAFGKANGMTPEDVVMMKRIRVVRGHADLPAEVSDGR